MTQKETPMNGQQGSDAGDISHSGIIDLLPASGFVLAILAVAAAVLAGFGTRWGWWNFRSGFAILKVSAYGGVAAAVASIAGGIIAVSGRSRMGLIPAAAGVLIGLLTAGIPWSWMRTVKQVPFIHDITTDMENPPKFAAVLQLRKDAANPAEYGGPDIAVQQRNGYPDIVPLRLRVPPDQAFERALQAARDSGWEIIAAKREECRIEATDTTFWFGFKDDVVIRITPAPDGSRVDIRSLSRVGKSDVGTNAKRIRAYFQKLERTK